MASSSPHRQALNIGNTGKSRAGPTIKWKRCVLCIETDSGGKSDFKTSTEFIRHLREHHCSKEGGSYVCRYGHNGVCPSLPLEGVSDRDYEVHVARQHACLTEVSGYSSMELSPTNSAPSVVTDQDQWTVYHSTQNLPAVLNDPRKAKREPDFFTKTWGEGFEKNDILPSPFVPQITRIHFERYLRKTSAKFKFHKKMQQSILDNELHEHQRPVVPAHRDKSKADLEQVPK
ncbi:vacuolar protein sorting-associated protein 54-like, partial [Saccoglossus kowalevskii]|uniref:Vacuolar protein sorting-associated protein 54-like n=1 Tax=Saccoglossus kowalevskii TaxID=10224 RepID=A0ABM0GKZ2_SACKO